MLITTANEHDINFLKQLELEAYTLEKTILGDQGYISATVQTDLFITYYIRLFIPHSTNHKACVKPNNSIGRKRRRVEVQFAQL